MNQKQYVDLIAEIETRFPVQHWKYRGIPVWPVARIEARSESLRSDPNGNTDGTPRNRGGRAITQLLRYVFSPLIDKVRNCADFDQEALRLRPVDVLFLGDNTSSDFIAGVWRERYNAPVAEAFARAGNTSLVLQPGERQRLPRSQVTYSVNWVDRWSRIVTKFLVGPDEDFPGFPEFERFLHAEGINLACFDRKAMKQSAARIYYMSHFFGRILARTKPKLVVVVSYYHEIGYALLHACRTRSILTVDIQHGGQGGAHEAYNRWHGLPSDGYSVLPSIFWNWSQRDANYIREWCTPQEAWHDSIWGGHPQLESWFDETNLQTIAFDKQIASLKECIGGNFDILVPLQDLERYTERWNALARLVEASPPNWRWWLRRHPSAAYNSGNSLNSLFAVKRTSFLTDQASLLPLPALLRNMNCILCLLSSTAFEASEFGHRTIFITEDARDLWPDLIESGQADVITDMKVLLRHMQELQTSRNSGYREKPPSLDQVARKLITRATAYGKFANPVDTEP